MNPWQSLKKSHLHVSQIIKAGQPVFFGCDVGQSSHTAFGIMDTGLYDVETAFSIKLGLNKADRLRTGESAMTHGEHNIIDFHDLIC
jgi:aminopeptidase C